jgi:hypothetical protein
MSQTDLFPGEDPIEWFEGFEGEAPELAKVKIKGSKWIFGEDSFGSFINLYDDDGKLVLSIGDPEEWDGCLESLFSFVKQNNVFRNRVSLAFAPADEPTNDHANEDVTS